MTPISLPELPPAVTKHVSDISSACSVGTDGTECEASPLTQTRALGTQLWQNKIWSAREIKQEEAEVGEHQHHLCCQCSGQPLSWEADTPGAPLKPIDNPWKGLAHTLYALTAVREVTESAEWQICSLMTSNLCAILFPQIFLFSGFFMLQELPKQKGLCYLSHSSTKSQSEGYDNSLRSARNRKLPERPGRIALLNKQVRMQEQNCENNYLFPGILSILESARLNYRLQNKHSTMCNVKKANFSWDRRAH